MALRPVTEGVESVKRVLINMKKEGVKKEVKPGSSSSLPLSSSLSPLKSIIYCLYPLLKRLLKLGNLVLNRLRFLDLN